MEKWLLLIHQIPPSPAYLRAKILRRLKDIGAVALKKSAYLLPDGDETLEDFTWSVKEIHAEGADAWLLRAEAVAGLSDDAIREMFRDLRNTDYRELLSDAQALREESDDSDISKNPAELQSILRKLKKRYNELRKIDFFTAPSGREVEMALDEIERRLSGGGAAPGSAPERKYQGRTWVTRRGIKIDRTACCWLIKRVIDPAATITFVDPNQYVHRAGELRFDMFEGEFTHDGDLCSFEVLLRKCDLHESALQAIGEIVHDLDLKDGKFGRAETQGVATMIEGIGLRHSGDAERLEEGLIIFDALYARLRSGLSREG